MSEISHSPESPPSPQPEKSVVSNYTPLKLNRRQFLQQLGNLAAATAVGTTVTKAQGLTLTLPENNQTPAFKPEQIARIKELTGLTLEDIDKLGLGINAIGEDMQTKGKVLFHVGQSHTTKDSFINKKYFDEIYSSQEAIYKLVKLIHERTGKPVPLFAESFGAESFNKYYPERKNFYNALLEVGDEAFLKNPEEFTAIIIETAEEFLAEDGDNLRLIATDFHILGPSLLKSLAWLRNHSEKLATPAATSSSLAERMRQAVENSYKPEEPALLEKCQDFVDQMNKFYKNLGIIPEQGIAYMGATIRLYLEGATNLYPAETLEANAAAFDSQAKADRYLIEANKDKITEEEVDRYLQLKKIADNDIYNVREAVALDKIERSGVFEENSFALIVYGSDHIYFDNAAKENYGFVKLSPKTK